MTFGDAAGSVRAWSETTSSALGISATQALKASSSFGSFFKQAGFSQGAAAKMSTTLVQLAGDIASFKDVDVDTALAAISSGLAGESEPMRRLGVDLRATRIDADALKYGFAATRAEISETDRTASRFVSMLDQLKDAQGDAARTADDYANTQRRFNTSLDQLKATAGQKTLPFLTDMTEGLTTLINATEKGPKAFKATGVSIAEIGNALVRAGGVGAATGGAGFFPKLFIEIGKAGRGTEETLSKQAAAMKVYEEAVAGFGRTSPQATGAQGALRREMDEAERQYRQTAEAAETTAQATGRFRAESAAAVGTIRSFVDAQRGAEDANLRVGDSRRGVEEAERSLSETRRRGRLTPRPSPTPSSACGTPPSRQVTPACGSGKLRSGWATCAAKGRWTPSGSRTPNGPSAKPSEGWQTPAATCWTPRRRWHACGPVPPVTRRPTPPGASPEPNSTWSGLNSGSSKRSRPSTTAAAATPSAPPSTCVTPSWRSPRPPTASETPSRPRST